MFLPIHGLKLKRVRHPVVASLIVFLLVVGCSPKTKEVWIKPKRSLDIPADVHKALLISGNSSVLSSYGPLSGILREMLPVDLGEFSPPLAGVDWSKEQCLWTFDAAVSEVSIRGSDLRIRFAPQKGVGIQFWFFEGASFRKIKRLKYD
jgi:hypothetical protein